MNRFCRSCGTLREVFMEKMAGGMKAIYCKSCKAFVDTLPDYDYHV